jgi:hypothetical protein
MPPRKKNGQAALPGMPTMADLRDTLWKAADKLRGSMDAAQYKDFVLGLVFLKYVSDSFVERRDQIRGMVTTCLILPCARFVLINRPDRTNARVCAPEPDPVFMRRRHGDRPISVTSRCLPGRSPWVTLPYISPGVRL